MEERHARELSQLDFGEFVTFCPVLKEQHLLVTVMSNARKQKDPAHLHITMEASGCNQVIGSNARIDRCGICSGNGNSCKHVKGEYIKQWKELGKQNADLIVELPPGTMSAKFVEKAATYNKIGIKSKDGDYLIDPDKAKSVKLSYAGADIVYIYKGKNKRAEEILEITGPTTAKLNIMFVAVDGENAGVGYELQYQLNQNIKLNYRWIVGNWSTCSATCARGKLKAHLNKV
ncbi:hypothetical protein OS493_035321 [Desmophyllum pertusum]|uniref:ADAMTS/ADAMTS-like Spacer 1 domain-containing protein n=1 Tax=Desmophyllum pertusum TaxID=174260 RepID=A0A9W9YIM1_9CNID|nr:hypothetical protein OS493_035321 [Desmophyllum pertusum]